MRARASGRPADPPTSPNRNRADALARARAHAAAGNAVAAVDCYRRAVDITPGHAQRLIEALQARGVAFIVAPYEADAQMAYLARTGAVAGVVTEDSDLLPYGAPVVLFKLDRDGSAQRVARADVPAARNPRLAGFDDAMFLELCALAGCDFLPSLPGVGLKTAARHLARHRTAARVVRCLKLAGKPVPADYEAGLARAVAAFRHQTVFCPQRRALVPLTPLPEGGLPPPAGPCTRFLGPLFDDALAAGVAEGRLDPMTRAPHAALPPLKGQGQGGRGRGGGGVHRGGHHHGGRGHRRPAPPAPPARGALASFFGAARPAGPRVAPAPAPRPAGFAILGSKRPLPPPPLHASGAASQPALSRASQPSQLSASPPPASAPADLFRALHRPASSPSSPLEDAMAAERAAAGALLKTPGAAGAGWARGATPDGWRDFYGDTPGQAPASAKREPEAAAAPAPRWSAHFGSPAAAPAPPPPKRPALAARGGVSGLLGGLDHVARDARAAAAAVGARESENAGDAANAPPAPPARTADAKSPTAPGGLFARFAFKGRGKK